MARDLTPRPLSHRERGFVLFRRLTPRPGAAGRDARLRGLGALAALALLSALLAGCAFHPGGEQIAWQVGDQLWVANPDGSNARQIAPRDVAGYSWSPDHHELAFRYGVSASPPPAGAPWAAPETASEIAVGSVNGGQATQITPTGGGLVRSDAWWNPNGARLLYREYGSGAALAAVYFDSQNDQPVGIARKVVLDAAALPTLSPDGMRVAVIDPSGAVRVGAPAQTGAVEARGAALALPGTGRPARLLLAPRPRPATLSDRWRWGGRDDAAAARFGLEQGHRDYQHYWPARCRLLARRFAAAAAHYERHVDLAGEWAGSAGNDLR